MTPVRPGSERPQRRVINPIAIPPLTDDDPVSVFVSRITNRDRLYFVQGVLLTAYMLYPNNERRRNQFVAAEEPVRQQLLAYSGQQHPAFFEQFGGVAEISAAARELLLAEAEPVTEKEWPRTGRILRAVCSILQDERTASLRGGASVEKAMAVLGVVKPHYQRSTLVRAWRVYTDVAHLLAATDYLVEQANLILEPEGRDRAFHIDAPFVAPEAVVKVGLGFQRFGLDHPVHGKSRSLLRRETLWRIPDIGFPREVLVPFQELSQEQVAVLLGDGRAL